MTPDNERQRSWHEAVRAFRLTATVFFEEDRSSKLLAALTGWEEGFRSLEQELPLVDFSPLGVLPDDAGCGRAAEIYRPAAVTDRTMHRPEMRRDSRPDAERFPTSWLPGGSRDLPVTPPDAGELTYHPPVFSLRRDGASGVRAGQQPSRRDPDAREHPASAGEHKRGRESGPVDSRRGGPGAVETSPDLNVSARSEVSAYDRVVEPGHGAKKPAVQRHSSVQPMDLLDGLAGDALGAAEQPTPDVPVRGPSMPPAARSEDQMVRSQESGRRIERNTEDDERASGGSGPPRLFASSPSSTGSLTGPTERGSLDPLLTSPGESPSFAPKPPLNNSGAALIDSLTERLLAPRAQFTGGSSTTPEPRDSEVEGSVAVTPWGQAEEDAISHHSPATFLYNMKETPVGPSGSEPLNAGRIAQTSFDLYTEAEDFASLVNDVLVRQARRHGVDLS